MCVVDIYDGIDEGSDQFDSVTIQNRPPIIENIYFLPSSIQTNQEYLKCLTETTDVNEDTVYHSYSWDVNGIAVLGNFEVLEYPFSFGDEIGCTVTVTDSMGGFSSQRNAITVANTTPQIQVNLQPEDVFWNSELRCALDIIDPDNQNMSIVYEWFHNQIPITNPSEILLLTMGKRNDTITCKATVNDLLYL